MVPAKSVEEYLARVPEPARSTLEKVRAVVKGCAPEGTEERVMYRMPMFYYRGMLIGLAFHKQHCALYVTSKKTLIPFAKELAGYSTAAGTVRFPHDQPLPAALIKKLVKARVLEQEAKR